jgi:signal transduction histidine kinase/BarA-like signal transduction histidine kinase
MELPAGINTSISNAIALLDSMSAGICAIDHNYNYIAFNTAHKGVVKRSLGIDIRIGDSYPDTVIPDPTVRESEMEIFSRVINGENIQAIADFGDTGLYRARYNVSYNPVRDEYGHIAGITIFSQDISEITVLQQENAEKTQLLKGITSNLPVTIYKINKDGFFTFSTGAILKEIRIKPNEIMGLNMMELYPHMTPYLKRALNGEVVRFETTANGIYRELHFQNIMFPDENSGGVVGFALDITDNKDAEVALLKAKEVAEEAAESKHKFLSNMSHEIRTPINGIIGLTNLLLQENPDDEKLKLLRFSGETLLVLINDILDYSKLQSGKITFEEIPFNLPLLISSIKSSHDLLAKEKGIRFRIRRDVEVPDVVIGDPVRLTQVLNNLIGNAMKFTNEGYVMMDISLNTTTSSHVYIDFSIEDTGIGIDDSMKDYIFESFTQANADTTRLFGGTGLGLAITRQLLQLQQSDISFESISGKGSVFSFSLAFKKGKEAILPTVQNLVRNMQNFAGKKVLLAEDNEINRIVAAKFMQSWLLKIDFAVTGTEAVKKMKTGDYDLILMDLQMPGLDGYEASQEIRTFNISIPIIALTASAMPEIKNKVKQAGMNDYMTKPFVPDRLFEVLARHLSG